MLKFESQGRWRFQWKLLGNTGVCWNKLTFSFRKYIFIKNILTTCRTRDTQGFAEHWLVNSGICGTVRRNLCWKTLVFLLKWGTAHFPISNYSYYNFLLQGEKKMARGFREHLRFYRWNNEITKKYMISQQWNLFDKNLDLNKVK